MIYTYNPRTATVIVYLLPTGLALIYMHPNDKRRELCIQSKLARAEVEKWHKRDVLIYPLPSAGS